MSKKKSKASKKSSTKKSKKAVHKKEDVEMESQTQEHVNIALISGKASETPSDAQPETSTKAKKKETSGKGKDENGFTIGSKSSLIYSLLSDGNHTREEIISILNEKYPAANNKSSLSTFISDVQKPVGTYSTSRGVKVVISEDGVISIEKVRG